MRDEFKLFGEGIAAILTSTVFLILALPLLILMVPFFIIVKLLTAIAQIFTRSCKHEQNSDRKEGAY